MTKCGACGAQLTLSGSTPSIRSGDIAYHLACAPTPLVEGASEEFRAVMKKGVRYFVDKYSDTTASPEMMGKRFLELGQAIEAERERRPASGVSNRQELASS